MLFTCAWVGFGAAWPGYDPRTHFISELAASDSPYAIPMVGAFFALGVLTLVFAAGFRRALGTSAVAALAPLLIAIFGAGSIGSGLARCDPGCGGSSLANHLHTVITYCGLGSLTLAALTFPWAIGHDPRWRGYRIYSWLSGALAAAVFLRGFPNFGGLGLGQRLFVTILLLWLALVAARFYRVSAAPP